VVGLTDARSSAGVAVGEQKQTQTQTAHGPRLHRCRYLWRDLALATVGSLASTPPRVRRAGRQPARALTWDLHGAASRCADSVGWQSAPYEIGRASCRERV